MHIRSSLLLLASLCALPACSTSSPSALQDARPSDAQIEAWIMEGRTQLAAGRAVEATATFERAADADDQSLRTRQWVVRSWLAQGRINDALDATDALARAGGEGPPIDYLYGMAFAFKGREYIQQNVQGQIIDMALADAVTSLAKATRADPVQYEDAFLPLAEAAWFRSELDIARGAAEVAVRTQPDDADAQLLLGKIALSQHVALLADAERSADAAASSELARASFARAAELYRARASSERSAAQALVELGHTHAWRAELDLAAQSYGDAAVLDASVLDFARVHGALGGERFLALLERADAEFAARAAADAPAPDATGAATLAWWLGWAHFDRKQFAAAETAFERALAQNPEYLNSWYYIALARHEQQDFDGALQALRANWEASPEALVASLDGNRDASLALLDALVGWCAENDASYSAGLLSEMQTAVAPREVRYWNNMGLFYRDAGESLLESEDAADAELAARYFEKAYDAYSTALEMTPEDPAILNDTAVVLHYYLDRELDRARAMYVLASERATAELARTDLDDGLRELYQTALRDSRNNLELLDADAAKRD